MRPDLGRAPSSRCAVATDDTAIPRLATRARLLNPASMIRLHESWIAACADRAGRSCAQRLLWAACGHPSLRAMTPDRPVRVVLAVVAVVRELDQPARRVGAVLESNDFHPGRSGREHLRVLALAAEIPQVAWRRCWSW